MLKYRTINIFFLALLAFVIVFNQYASVSIWIYVSVALAYVGIQAYGSSVLSAQYFVPVRFRGDEHSNKVALTFDDGPVAGKTEKILHILKRYEVPGAFFCIGTRVSEHREVIRSIHEEGHLVCNHSYWHRPTFDLQPASRIATELRDTDTSIREAIGLRPLFFRPPFGVTNPMVAKAIKSGGYTTVGWTIRTFDTVISDRKRLMKRIAGKLTGGDIILLHDYGAVTLEILPALIEHIASVGLKIVRLDELLNESPYASEA